MNQVGRTSMQDDPAGGPNRQADPGPMIQASREFDSFGIQKQRRQVWLVRAEGGHVSTRLG